MPDLRAVPAHDPGVGVDLRDPTSARGEFRLRIGDATTGIDPGYCNNCREDLVKVSLPEDFSMTIEGEEYQLPERYFVAVCPGANLIEGTDGPTDEDLREKALNNIRWHWDQDRLREPFERESQPVLEERVEDLEKQVARLQEQLAALEDDDGVDDDVSGYTRADFTSDEEPDFVSQ